MDVREKLIKLLSDNFVDFINVDIVAGNCKIRAITFNADDFADCLIANGVTITPAVPGPEIADPNIMELCFHNGERHMKEKVCRELTRIAEHMPCITLAQAIQLLEGL
mgnify:CR=1 FL=1